MKNLNKQDIQSLVAIVEQNNTEIVDFLNLRIGSRKRNQFHGVH